MERADPKPALLVHADSDTASPLYVRTALESSAEAAFTLESVAANQAANANVPKYAFVILSDPGPLPEKLEDALDKYVQAGGSVLMTLGKNATPGRHLPLADLQVMGLHTIVPDHEALLTVARSILLIPSFSRAQNWGGVEFYQAAKLQLPQASPDTRVAATLSDGSPLFIDRKIGEGHVLVFTSALDNIANNLPLQPVWLPFLDQTTHEMGGIGTAPGNYKVGSFVELRTAQGKRRSGGDRRPGRQAAVDAGGIDQSAHVPVSVAGIFRYSPRQRAGRTGLGQCGPAGVRFCDRPGGDARIVEKYRDSPEVGAELDAPRPRISVTTARNSGGGCWRC